MDVSKYLKFACGSTPFPNWERLLDRDMIIAFIDKCKRFKLEADGQISKLDSLEAGLVFIRHRMLKDDSNHHTFQQVTLISDSIKGWKAALRKMRTKRRMRRLEKLSSSTLSLDDVDDVLQNEDVWSDFVDVSNKLCDELPVSTRKMNACMIMVATILTFCSWQRPGAVANATLAEYKNRTEIWQKGRWLQSSKWPNTKPACSAVPSLPYPPKTCQNCTPT